MPRIEAFKGILYNPKKVNPSKVVAPPYDVIPLKMQDDLYRMSRYNIVRLILGKQDPADSDKDNRYTRAREFFNGWLKNNVLIQDRTPAVYVYSQRYKYNGEKKVGLGFIARMEIEDPKTSRVLPHENTFSKPKEDRLNLIRQVKANLSCIFTLFQDEDNKVSSILKAVTKKKPVFNVVHESVRHMAWRLDDKALINKIQALMADKDIFIADGHHRYEVANMYRNEMRQKEGQKGKKGYDCVMMYFSPIGEEGLTILSTHRLIKNIGIPLKELLEKLNDYFDIKTCKSGSQLFKQMSSLKTGEYAFGMYYKKKKFYLLKLKKSIDLDSMIKEDRTAEWKRLDVSVLHGLIFNNILGLKERIANEENVIYTRDPQHAIKEVNKGGCEATFFLNPTKVNQVKDIAKIGEKMPHKSTYFYPKLLSGLVINKLC